MRNGLVSLLAWLLASGMMCAEELQPLPTPLTNNAVTAVRVNGTTLVYSFMGLGAQKNWTSVSNAAYAFNLRYNKWTTIRSAPGTGRLGAIAVSARQQIFLLGGFVPDQSGYQAIVPDVSVYDPIGLRWYRGPDLPVPVRDAVAGVYRDRFLYVIGGYSRQGPTNAVQLYDMESQRWSELTPLPGPAVFGLAGTVVDDTIVYVDGAKKNPENKGVRFVASDECWMGKIDHHDPKKIQWTKIPSHPGTARYRIAAGGSDRESRAYFAGGSDAIYDYNGVGLDGKPAEPSPVVFAFNVKTGSWESIQDNAPKATMDHRGMAVTSDGLIVVGGMGAGPVVVGTVSVLPKSK